jgi:hypothetical protein
MESLNFFKKTDLGVEGFEHNRDNELPPESVDLAHVICSDWASLAK